MKPRLYSLYLFCLYGSEPWSFLLFFLFYVFFLVMKVRFCGIRASNFLFSFYFLIYLFFFPCHYYFAYYFHQCVPLTVILLIYLLQSVFFPVLRYDSISEIQNDFLFLSFPSFLKFLLIMYMICPSVAFSVILLINLSWCVYILLIRYIFISSEIQNDLLFVFFFADCV